MASTTYCPCRWPVSPHVSGNGVSSRSRQWWLGQRTSFWKGTRRPSLFKLVSEERRRGFSTLEQKIGHHGFMHESCYSNMHMRRQSWTVSNIRGWSGHLRARNGDVDDEDDDDEDGIEELSMATGRNGAGIYRLPEGRRVSRGPAKSSPPPPPPRAEGVKWPLWILGPLALLATGAVPALWLPTPSLFTGSRAAGILALAGLDGTFNLGSTVFLLAADTCARGSRNEGPSGVVTLHSVTPFGYKVWSILVSTAGLLATVLAFAASWYGLLPEASNLLWAAMLGPYAALLVVQMCVETLVWRWQSPVWPVAPLIYQGYRIFQLSRGIQLGLSLGAPSWLVHVSKGLVSWWVVVLGMQLMWIAWLTGSTRSRSSKQVTHLTVGHLT